MTQEMGKRISEARGRAASDGWQGSLSRKQRLFEKRRAKNFDNFYTGC